MLFKFMPREFNFFDLFEKQVGFAVEAANYLKELTQKGSIDEAAIDKMTGQENVTS